MQFSCTQENFRIALGLLSHIAARQGTLPILSNVLLRAESKVLTLVATNLELAMTCALRGKVEEDGAVTVNAKLLGDVVNLLPKDRVDAQTHSAELELSCRGSNTKVRGMDAAEFPLIPTVDRGAEARVRIQELREALGSTAFAVAATESRPELAGVLITFESSALTVVATDSYRLAERKLPVIATTVPAGMSVIVPARTIQEVLRVLGVLEGTDDAGEEVAIAVTPTQLLITIGGLQVVSRLIDGTYPDYAQIIPRSASTRVRVPRGELQSIVRAASLFARTGVNDVHLRMLPNEHQLVVRSENAQLGEYQSIVSAEVTGDAAQTILNARYLLDGLAAIPDADVFIELTGAVAPVVIRPAELTGYLYIVMPIKQ